MRVDGAGDVGVELGRVERPEGGELGDRVALGPVDAEVGDRPGDLADELHPGRVDRAGLAAGVEAGLHRGEQAVAERPGGGGEALDHRRGARRHWREDCRRRRRRCLGRRRRSPRATAPEWIAEPPAASTARSWRWSAKGALRAMIADRLGRGRALLHQIEGTDAEARVGDVLARDRADPGACMGAASGDGRRRGGDGDAEHAGLAATGDDREGHGLSRLAGCRRGRPYPRDRFGFLAARAASAARLKATAARTSVAKAVASRTSPSRMSMARRVLPSRLALNRPAGSSSAAPLGEGQLDHRLVGLAGAEDAGVRPDRHAAPLPFLDHRRVGLADQPAHARERLAAPVAERGNARVDQSRGRRGAFRAGCHDRAPDKPRSRSPPRCAIERRQASLFKVIGVSPSPGVRRRCIEAPGRPPFQPISATGRAERAGALRGRSRQSGMTAVASISTSHSGRARAVTTSPVETGCTPRIYSPIVR